MRSSKCNRCLDLCLVLIMLFAGMCLDINRTDSFFESASRSRHISAIFVLEKESPVSVVCTAELLGRREAVYTIVPSRRTDDRNLSPLRLFLSLAILLSAILISICPADTGELHHEIHGSAVTVRYIHNQDGAKSPQ